MYSDAQLTVANNETHTVPYQRNTTCNLIYLKYKAWPNLTHHVNRNKFVSKSTTNLILDDRIHQRIQKSGNLRDGLTVRPHLFNADTLSGL